MYIFTIYESTHRKNKEITYYIILITHTLWGKWVS